jgi:glycosyltransferase involved in cell wall biosynthesis
VVSSAIMGALPLVSVVTPTHNSARWLADTLASIRGQSYPNLEIIVVDDGSSDSSTGIARKFDAKVLVLHNSSAGEARNHGIENSTGKYIQFLDSDDILSSNKIATQVAALERTADNWIAASPLTYFYDGDHPERSELEDGEWIADSNSVSDWVAIALALDGRRFRMVPGGCYLVPRTIVQRAGPWMTQPSPDDDGEFFLRVVLESRGVKGTSGRLYYRKFRSPISLSGTVNERWLRGVYAAIELKTATLLQHRNDPEVFRYAGRNFAGLAFDAYPDYPDIYRASVKAAHKYGVTTITPHFATKLGTVISGAFGWKAAKHLQKMRLNLRARLRTG